MQGYHYIVFSPGTMLGGVLLILTALAAMLSSCNQETWRQPQLKSDVQQKNRGSTGAWIAKKCREGNYGHFLFLLFYFGLNGFCVFYFFLVYY
eukprot:TRINITY_DN11102_c0_g1_i1.p1 TRINITY_DN11102_c0_g1~~TRINITY_DN11102_c0_g1_i1.p1  ORF type:complete len:93 (+),score=6.93 TRINITY_DN11102_c0_g1_i1:79-357(+)